MRILVVDDTEDSRDIIEAALHSGGYRNIVTVASGWEAFKFLDIGHDGSRAPPAADIVLLDIMMPEIDGIETCARIRNDQRYVDTPIIMVTSLDDMESLSNAFVAGANDYITKPLNRIELIARVRSALKLKAELERRQAREHELLQFLSIWGEKHAAVWIDDATGLFVGEVSEAYLTAAAKYNQSEMMSILALAVDRLDVIRAREGEDAARRILARVAGAVRGVAASVGVVAASYRNGMITVVAPDHDRAGAQALGETLRRSVAGLADAQSQATGTSPFTASIAVATGRARGGLDQVDLLTRAIAAARETAAAGGNRVVAVAA